MNPQEFTNWIDHIYATRDKELDCDTTQSLLPAYVESELDGSAIHPLASEIKVHLQQCPGCTETYQGLRYLVKLEANGELALADEELDALELRASESERTPVATP